MRLILLGRSDSMKSKDWRDASGRKGKVTGDDTWRSLCHPWLSNKLGQAILPSPPSLCSPFFYRGLLVCFPLPCSHTPQLITHLRPLHTPHPHARYPSCSRTPHLSPLRSGNVGHTLPFISRPQGLGVFRFANKYGVNVDGYSPIYTPDTWSESGNTYSLGTKGLLAW